MTELFPTSGSDGKEDRQQSDTNKDLKTSFCATFAVGIRTFSVVLISSCCKEALRWSSHTHTHITNETTVEKEKTALQVEGRKGYKKEPGAPHLGPIRSVMFLATIYKTDGTKLDEPDSFF